MQHQDWNIVILKKKKDTPQPRPKDTAATLTPSLVPAWKIEKRVDSDEGPPVIYVGAELARQITKARIENKLTQKGLAQKVNLQEKDIKDIESGKAVLNNQHISKIKRVLNMHAHH